MNECNTLFAFKQKCAQCLSVGVIQETIDFQLFLQARNEVCILLRRQTLPVESSVNPWPMSAPFKPPCSRVGPERRQCLKN